MGTILQSIRFNQEATTGPETFTRNIPVIIGKPMLWQKNIKLGTKKLQAQALASSTQAPTCSN
ncbi:MAG: hypothetical protein AB8E15_10625 [Bdellovibrionales bacterium]